MKKENILKLSDKEIETILTLLIEDKEKYEYFLKDIICASSDIVKNYNSKLKTLNTIIKKIEKLMEK